MARGLVETADLTLNRRTLLAAAAGGAAMAIGCGSGSEPTDSAPAAVNGWTPPDDERRRALVATARFGPKQAVRSANGLAICTHPLASAAAADMLALGGNACDGVLAASIAQAVVEPHMTTLSGCLSMLYYDAASGEYTYVNGMMAAPQAVPDVRKMDVAEFGALMTKTDGTLCFVPGFWGGFEAGLERHGLLPRATVMAPAIHYARDGFEIHPFLWGEMFVESAVLGREPFSREIYFNGSTLRDIGDKLVQSTLADTLDRLAEEGGDHFYRGEFGRRYAETVQARGGLITADDMAAYVAFWDEPVKGTYRDYGVVGSPAPDFGGQALVEIMNMVELLDLQQAGPAFESGETTLKMMQIIGRVYADAVGGRFDGTLPGVERATSKEYAAERFAALEGRPAGPNDRYEALGVVPPPPPGSNHVTVVDAAGERRDRAALGHVDAVQDRHLRRRRLRLCLRRPSRFRSGRTGRTGARAHLPEHVHARRQTRARVGFAERLAYREHRPEHGQPARLRPGSRNLGPQTAVRRLVDERAGRADRGGRSGRRPGRAAGRRGARPSKWSIPGTGSAARSRAF